MTQDDTFNALKRTPIKEVSNLMWLIYLSENTAVMPLSHYLDKGTKVASRDALLQEHGWTIDSYLAAIYPQDKTLL